MSVTMHNGVGYGQSARIIDKSVSAKSSVSTEPPDIRETTIKDFKSFPFRPWGANNRLPLEMLQSLEGCGILGSIVDSQARLALGNGVMWAYTHKNTDGTTVVDSIASIAEIDEFMEENDHFMQEWAWMQDLRGFKMGCARMVFNSEATRKIVTLRRDDITEVRFEVPKNGVVQNIYLCAEWDKVSSVNDDRIIKVALVNPHQPQTSLNQYAKAGVNEIALTFKGPTWNKKDYPMADWQPSQDWINIDRKIPKMKDAMFEHNFRPRYQVTIFEEFWEKRFNGDADSQNWSDYTDKEKEAKRQEVYDDIDKHLTGTDNHGKAIYVSGWYDKITGKSYSEIQIVPIEDLIKEGDMLPESATATSEIAFGMKYNPAIIGASLPSGPYTNSQGGSNVRESVTVQILIHEPERQRICRIYNIIKKFNGWDTEYPKGELKLEPIMPTTILTTLDTGGGTKSAIPGGQPGEDKKPATPSNPNA